MSCWKASVATTLNRVRSKQLAVRLQFSSSGQTSNHTCTDSFYQWEGIYDRPVSDQGWKQFSSRLNYWPTQLKYKQRFGFREWKAQIIQNIFRSVLDGRGCTYRRWEVWAWVGEQHCVFYLQAGISWLLQCTAQKINWFSWTATFFGVQEIGSQQ